MYPRAKALGLIYFNDSILLEKQCGKHSKGEGFYYRPIGGTIEMGERSNETLVREFQEELNVEIEVEEYVSCLENIFRIGDSIGHEIIQVYTARFKDQQLYEKQHFSVTEGNSVTFAYWVPINKIRDEKSLCIQMG